MATINAAAAMQMSVRSTIAAVVLIVAGGLAGCSSGGDGILSGGNSLTAPVAQNKAQPRAKIAIAPVIGAPDQVAKQVVGQVSSAVKQNNIAISQVAGEPVDYTLRGYIVAARESTGTKVSYIWDVTNPTGSRVHRITGEEVVTGAGAGDPWASVSPQLIQVIASKTSKQLSAWMPQKAPRKPQPLAGSQAIAKSNVPRTSGSANTQIASATSTATATTVARTGAQAVPTGSSTATTGSIGSPAAVTALVPQVVGAPGDGSRSLATALRNELLRNGVKPTPPGSPAYRVEGRVKMGPVAGGQQPIKIDWTVRDPKGVSLGTVSQENKIPAGSLNGAWGSTANAAATAATQGILKLLPKRKAVAVR